jgi:hypothetical protein
MTLTGQFIIQHSVKVCYVRNVFGYRKGVVVKIGKGKDAKYGWSLVHKSDYDFNKKVKYNQLPVFQENIFHDKEEVLEKLLNIGGYVRSPKFNKEHGKAIAINRALQDPIQVEYEFPIIVGEMPHDKDLVAVLVDMFQHNRKYL